MLLSVREYFDKSFDPQSGKDIVLIHGTGARGEMWQKQVDLLMQEGYRCIVPDLRGHGDSPEPYEAANIEKHMEDILDSLPPFGIKYPTLFVGHSLGAIISLCLSEVRPELFSRILAVSMPGKVPALTKIIFDHFLGWPYSTIRKTSLHKRFAFRERVLLETNHFTLRQVVEQFASLNYIDNVLKVPCPVDFVVGRLDPVAPYYYLQQLQRTIPNSTLKIIEWAGHNCMDSQPAIFNKWFLEKIRQ